MASPEEARAKRQAGGAAASSWSPASPLCLPGKTKHLAGMGQHSAGPARWAGQVSGPGRCSLSLFSKLFYVFYCSVVFRALYKILKQIQKS